MTTKLTHKDIAELKAGGYSEEDIQLALAEIEEEELSKTFNSAGMGGRSRKYGQLSSFSTKQDDNIVRWQLELNDILERAEHILKGDIPQFENGDVIWDKSPNPADNPLNELGVAEVMKILAMYVNRNTILSDYSNEEINIKVYDFGRAVNNLVFMRYDEFGMDTDEKVKNYDILVRELVDIVHSAYKRALDGAEKRSLREMITVTQATSTSAQLGERMVLNNQGGVSKERGLLNPMRYLKGKVY